MLAGLEVWDLIAATKLGKPRARRARSSGPALMMAVMRLRLKSLHSQSPTLVVAEDVAGVAGIDMHVVHGFRSARW